MTASSKSAKKKQVPVARLASVVVRPIILEQRARASAMCATGRLGTKTHARPAVGRCVLGVGARMRSGVMSVLYEARPLESRVVVRWTRMSSTAAAQVVEGTRLWWSAVGSDARDPSLTRQKKSSSRSFHTARTLTETSTTGHALACCAIIRSVRSHMVSVLDVGRRPTGAHAHRSLRKSEEVTQDVRTASCACLKRRS